MIITESLACTPLHDRSNGYEGIASVFIEARRQANMGIGTTRIWAQSLSKGATVLDLGCGSGEPVSRILADEGLRIHGVDASPTLCAAYRHNFPHAPIACEAVEESAFFHRTFDAVVAIGLMFLLPVVTQELVIRKVARALNPHGRFLFTSPTQLCEWTDVLTSRRSISPGADAYKAALADSGLAVVGEYQDEGNNHYYDARKD